MRKKLIVATAVVLFAVLVVAFVFQLRADRAGNGMVRPNQPGDDVKLSPVPCPEGHAHTDSLGLACVECPDGSRVEIVPTDPTGLLKQCVPNDLAACPSDWICPDGQGREGDECIVCEGDGRVDEVLEELPGVGPCPRSVCLPPFECPSDLLCPDGQAFDATTSTCRSCDTAASSYLGLLEVEGVECPVSLCGTCGSLAGLPAAGDADSDGLSNALEIALGSVPTLGRLYCPLDADSDDDGVPDGFDLAYTPPGATGPSVGVRLAVRAFWQWNSGEADFGMMDSWWDGSNDMAGEPYFHVLSTLGAGVVPAAATPLVFEGFTVSDHIREKATWLRPDGSSQGRANIVRLSDDVRTWATGLSGAAASLYGPLPTPSITASLLLLDHDDTRPENPDGNHSSYLTGTQIPTRMTSLTGVDTLNLVMPLWGAPTSVPAGTTGLDVTTLLPAADPNARLGSVPFTVTIPKANDLPRNSIRLAFELDLVDGEDQPIPVCQLHVLRTVAAGTGGLLDLGGLDAAARTACGVP